MSVPDKDIFAAIVFPVPVLQRNVLILRAGRHFEEECGHASSYGHHLVHDYFVQPFARNSHIQFGVVVKELQGFRLSCFGCLYYEDTQNFLPVLVCPHVKLKRIFVRGAGVNLGVIVFDVFLYGKQGIGLLSKKYLCRLAVDGLAVKVCKVLYINCLRCYIGLGGIVLGCVATAAVFAGANGKSGSHSGNRKKYIHGLHLYKSFPWQRYENAGLDEIS